MNLVISEEMSSLEDKIKTNILIKKMCLHLMSNIIPQMKDIRDYFHTMTQSRLVSYPWVALT